MLYYWSYRYVTKRLSKVQTAPPVGPHRGIAVIVGVGPRGGRSRERVRAATADAASTAATVALTAPAFPTA